tara:strand:+ start:4229 stop:4594 length:366 start_codon:yes stop_codon:yes gene_type:complete
MKSNLIIFIFLIGAIIGTLVSLYTPSREGLENWDGTGEGVTGDDILDGDKDLYILKSQIVPPVCPRCPDAAVCPRKEPCPSCPPCARCPEPAFTCKKVPNYNSQNKTGLPIPMLNTFSEFR